MTTYLIPNQEKEKISRKPKNLLLKFFDNLETSLTETQGNLILMAENHLQDLFGSLHESFFKKQEKLRKRIKILVTENLSTSSQSLLEAISKEAIVIPPDAALPLHQRLEILGDKKAKNYVIGGQVDELTKTVTLIRGDLSKLAVPFSAFRPSGIGVQPDFKRFTIEDFGQTIKFGEYESSVDAILYEFDSNYRRERKAELAKKDKSFGACLRRLRVLKGLKQSNFPDVDVREIGRIERGEVKTRPSTIKKIAKRLRVTPEEIKTY